METKKAKRIVVLLFAFLLLCLAALIGIGVWKNQAGGNEVTNIDVDNISKGHATNEEELRELLASNEELTVTLKKDIYVWEPIYVNGIKTLKGDHSIIMAFDAKAYQDVLCVTTDSELVLDGTTIDGNALANGVEVEVCGKFTLLSGKIVYGFPYAVESAGNVFVQGGSIEDSQFCGVYVVAGGSADITGGKIITSMDSAVYIGDGATAKIRDDAYLCGSGNCIVINKGETEITGGVIADADKTLIKNNGEISVIGTEDKKLELCDAGRYGIWSEDGTLTKIENVYLHDTGYTGMLIVSSKNVDVRDCVIEKTGKDAIYVAKKTEATIEDITIKEAGTHGIRSGKNAIVHLKNATIENVGEMGLLAKEEGTIEFEDVVITAPKKRGIMCVASTITGKNAKITSPEIFGITCAGAGIVTIDDVEISGVKTRNGINAIEKSKVTITNGSITDVQKENGARAWDAGTKLVLKNMDIKNCASSGVVSDNGATAELENVNIANAKYAVRSAANAKVTMKKVSAKNTVNSGIVSYGGKINGSEVTVEATGTYGVYSGVQKERKGSIVLNNLTVKNTQTKNSLCVVSGASMQVTDATISDTLKASGVYVKDAGSKLTLKNATVVNSAGVGLLNNQATITAENVKVDTTKTDGIRSTCGTIKATELVIENAGAKGVYNQGGKFNGTNVTVKKSVDYGVVSSTYTKKYTDAQGSEVQEPITGNTSIANLTVTETVNNHGVYVSGGSSFTVNKGTISETKNGSGAYNNRSTMTLKNVAIDNSSQSGIYTVGRASESTLTTVAVTTSGVHGIENYSGNVIASDVKVNKATEVGVYSTGTDAKITVVGLDVTDTGSNGVTIKGKETVAIFSKARVQNAGGIGIYCQGGTLEGDTVQVDNTASYGVVSSTYDNTVKGNVTIQNLTVSNVQEKDGVYASGGASFKVLTGTVSSVANGNGVYSNKSHIELENVDIKENKSNGVYVLGGENVEALGEIICTGVTIESAGADGVRIEAQSPETATAILKNVTITNATGRGINAYGGIVKESEKVTINGAGAEGVYASVKSGVTTDLPYSLGNVTIADLNVSNTAKQGVLVNSVKGNAATATVIGGSIINVGDTESAEDKEGYPGAVANNRATLSMSGVTIENSKHSGVYTIGAASKTTLESVVIKKAGTHGIENYSGNVTATSITIADAAKNGIYMNGKKANTKLNGTAEARNLITKSGSDGILVDANNATEVQATIKYTTIDNSSVNEADNTVQKTGRDGIRIEANAPDAGKVLLESVIVKNVSNRGIHAYGGVILPESKDVTVDGTGGEGVYVTVKSGATTGAKYALGNVSITNLNVSNTTKCGLYVGYSGGNSSSLKVVGGSVINAGYTDTFPGAVSNNRSTLEMKDVTIENSKQDGFYVIGGASKTTLTGVTFTTWGRYGIYNDQGNITDSTGISMESTTGTCQVKTKSAKKTVINSITYAKNYEGVLRTE